MVYNIRGKPVANDDPNTLSLVVLSWISLIVTLKKGLKPSTVLRKPWVRCGALGNEKKIVKAWFSKTSLPSMFNQSRPLGNSVKERESQNPKLSLDF